MNNIKEFRVIVAGGRDFSNFLLLEEKLNALFANRQNVVIVSGAAKGADKLGEQYARKHNIMISSYPALWNQHGHQAGFIRNTEMAKNADACVCFWNGQSTGTKHMIDTAKELKLKLRIITY